MSPRVRGVIGRVLYVLLGAVLALWLLIFSGPVGAATFRGDEASCNHLGMFAAQVAELRDTGTPWETFDDWNSMMLEQARANPESYIKDQDDVDFVRAAMKRVFDNPQMTSEQAAAITTAECLKKPTSLKHGSV